MGQRVWEASNHLAGELFKKEAGGLDITHIPYKGAGPAMQEVIAGQIPLVIADSADCLAITVQAGYAYSRCRGTAVQGGS